MENIKSFLRKSQRNDLFIAIESEDLKHTDFDSKVLKETDFDANTYSVPQIIHKPTEYYFNFHSKPLGYSIAYSPQSISNAGQIYLDSELPWEDVVRFFTDWLKELKVELDTPDLWEIIHKENTLLEAAGIREFENNIISDGELVMIEKGITEIKEFIFRTQSPSEEQKEFIDGRLNYLVESGKRNAKAGWIQLAIGVLIAITLAMGMNPDETREFFKIASAAFRNVLSNPKLIQ